MSISKAVQLIKAGSSKWIHEEYPEKSEFTWQRGYGAFSVSAIRFPQTIAYIHEQEEHHQKQTFEEEYIQFLKLNGLDYDEKYMWG